MGFLSGMVSSESKALGKRFGKQMAEHAAAQGKVAAKETISSGIKSLASGAQRKMATVSTPKDAAPPVVVCPECPVCNCPLAQQAAQTAQTAQTSQTAQTAQTAQVGGNYTCKELKAIAIDIKLPGRSKMNKSQLLHELSYYGII